MGDPCGLFFSIAAVNSSAVSLPSPSVSADWNIWARREPCAGVPPDWTPPVWAPPCDWSCSDNRADNVSLAKPWARDSAAMAMPPDGSVSGEDPADAEELPPPCRFCPMDSNSATDSCPSPFVSA